MFLLPLQDVFSFNFLSQYLGSQILKVPFPAHSLSRAYSLALILPLSRASKPSQTLYQTGEVFSRSHLSLELNAEDKSIGGCSCLATLAQLLVTFQIKIKSLPWPRELCLPLPSLSPSNAQFLLTQVFHASAPLPQMLFSLFWLTTYLLHVSLPQGGLL